MTQRSSRVLLSFLTLALVLPSLTAATTISTKFTLGDRVVVTTGPLNVRVSAGGSILGKQPQGAFGTIIAGPALVNGRSWWKVDYDSGVDGWSYENYLSKAPTYSFSVGMRISVYNATVSVRSGGGTTETVLGTQAANSLGTIVGGPVVANGYTWWNINFDSGVDGWSVQNYLIPLSVLTTAALPTPVPAPSTILTALPAGYLPCAAEYASCTVPSGTLVYYGASGGYYALSMSGTFACDNSVFGDPYASITKGCYVPTVPPPSTWTLCAAEYGTCSFSGTRRILYGVSPTSQNTIGIFTGSVLCDNSVFTDPAVGANKSCWYEGVTTTAVAPTPTPTPTTLTVLPVGYVACAAEYASCTVSSGTLVYYGASGGYYALTMSGTFACDNSVFGDPLPGASKYCYAPSVTPVSTKFTLNDRVQVSSGPLNVRASANTTGTPLGTEAIGALGTIAGGPIAQGGYNWWQVNYDNGISGWSAEDYLEKYVTPISTASTWTLCAAEYGTCSFSGTRRILYGVSPTSQNTIGIFTGSVLCDNSVFTDPAVGASKSCWYENVTTSAVAVSSSVNNATASGPLTSATFQPTNTDFLNPERGWYVTPKDSEMTVSTLQGFVNQYNTRLMFYRIALDPYQNTDTLPASFITALNGRFAQGRAAGVKFVVNVNYDDSGNMPTTPVARMVLHAQQLHQLFVDNRDVIAYVEGGFISTYGEWSDPNATYAMKTQVRDAVMSMTSPETMISFTNSYTQMNWFPSPLTAAQAFTGTTQARMGWQNDCFLSGPTDSFQFPGPTQVADQNITTSQLEQRQYMQTISEYVPAGGEISVDSCNAPSRIDCTSSITDGAGQPGGILNEGPRIHLAWLHNLGSDSAAMMNAWKAQGCFDTVSRSMGYRFQLDSINHSSTANKGETVQVNVSLHNVGWSRIFSARKLIVTFQNRTTGEMLFGSTGDARMLPSQSTQSTTWSANVNIPSTASAGTYDVYLSMPDIYSTTKDNADYAVRFANADSGSQSWDAGSARMKTGTTVTVQ